MTALGADAERVLAHVAATLGEPAAWAAPPAHTGVALAMIDAVWGIGVRWNSVRNVMQRYSDARRLAGGDPDTDGPAELLALIDGAGGGEAFAGLVGNRQRTSTRNGLLKAEAVRQVAEVLHASWITTLADVRAATPEQLADLRAAWTEVPGQRSGLSLDAFLMVSGLPGVKADRMLRRFVADATGAAGEAAVTPARAAELVLEVAASLGVDPRRLDAAIWEYQSARVGSAAPQAD